MPTTTPLEPSDTLTPAPPHASITVRDLVGMLGHEDPDACVYVAIHVPPETVQEVYEGQTLTVIAGEPSDEVDFQPTSGIERRWYGGRKVVVVR